MGHAGATDSDLTSDLYALVVYLHVSCNRDLFDAIAAQQLSWSQLQLLEKLRGGRRAPTVRQAAAMMHVSPGGASRLVDALARRGLVVRENDDRDYRARRVTITERGEEAIMALHAARLAEVGEFAERLDAGERDQLHAALRPVLEREQIAAYRPPAAAA